ncbi:MAG: D-tyrosyl-tRNA(Tyr) deacylase [Ruminococcaceae bacterium]|nr:D-tyrosyl-tRNA(Tyr) deacylase [Oscillospiraceae bacterium]
MIAVLQRINHATVYSDGILTGSAQKGLYILLGVEKSDTERDALLLAEKISKLRIFTDENGKMNLSVNDVDGEVLVVSNFTLNANYAHGNRPDYLNGAAPDEANRLYEFFLSEMKKRVRKCESGVFGSDMRTEMSTDGPVTIVMNSTVLDKSRKA